VIGSFIFFTDELALVRSKYFWIGMILLVSGFVGMNINQGNLDSFESTGLWIIVGQAFFLACYGISMRYYMRGINPIYSFSIICMYTTVGLLIIMFLFGNPSELFEMKTSRVGMLILSAFIGISFSHILFYDALEHLGVSISNGCLLFAPFLTIIGSYVIFDEKFSPIQWLFGISLLIGAFLLLLAQQHLGSKSKNSTS
jgi:drug/metabolite transporter (DMT)-like permease